MPRGQNLDRARQPREEPGEAAQSFWVRGEKPVVEAFRRLPAEERGKVVKAGLEALGYLRGEERREP
jgi:NADPH-dependent ferric siderophore reductase